MYHMFKPHNPLNRRMQLQGAELVFSLTSIAVPIYAGGIQATSKNVVSGWSATVDASGKIAGSNPTALGGSAGGAQFFGSSGGGRRQI